MSAFEPNESWKLSARDTFLLAMAILLIVALAWMGC